MFAYFCGVVINNEDYEEMFVTCFNFNYTNFKLQIVLILFNFVSPVDLDFGT